MPRSVVPPQSWGDRSDTKHSKCLLLGGRRLNQLTLIPKLKGSGGARAATAPGKPQSAQQSQTQVFSPAARPQVPRGDVTHCFYSNCDVIDV